MAFRIARKQQVNVMKIGMKIIATVIGLWISGLMLRVVGDVMTNTSSPFYEGLTLIGWTVATTTNASGVNDCASNSAPISGVTINNCVTATNGTGILSVIGLLAIVWILFEFVEIRI